MIFSYKTRNEGEHCNLTTGMTIVKTTIQNGYSIGVYLKSPLSRKVADFMDHDSFELRVATVVNVYIFRLRNPLGKKFIPRFYYSKVIEEVVT